MDRIQYETVPAQIVHTALPAVYWVRDGADGSNLNWIQSASTIMLEHSVA